MSEPSFGSPRPFFLALANCAITFVLCGAHLAGSTVDITSVGLLHIALLLPVTQYVRHEGLEELSCAGKGRVATALLPDHMQLLAS